MSESSETKRAAALMVLDDLASELDKGYLEETFSVAGHKWTMRLLQDHERNWANGFIRNNSLHSMLTSVRAPVLSIGIRAIDGIPVPEFFQKQWEEDELSVVAKQMMENSNPFIKQYWFAERLFAWLSQRPPHFVEKLWAEWSKLEGRREKAEEAMGKSSTPDGISNSQTDPTIGS